MRTADRFFLPYQVNNNTDPVLTETCLPVNKRKQEQSEYVVCDLFRDENNQ